MPQYAIAQPGSVFSTPSNPLRASGNQNECSSATAWLNASFAAALHDVSKFTVPTAPPGAACWCWEWSSPCAHDDGATRSKQMQIVGMQRFIQDSFATYLIGYGHAPAGSPFRH